MNKCDFFPRPPPPLNVSCSYASESVRPNVDLNLYHSFIFINVRSVIVSLMAKAANPDRNFSKHTFFSVF